MIALSKYSRPYTVFDGPLVLLLLSAVLGAWLAYHQAAGWGKFLLILGGVALYYGITQIPDRIYLGGGIRLFPLYLLFLLFPSLLAIYFLVTNDWLGEIGNPPMWQDPLRRWLGMWQLSSWGSQLHSNQAGGMIAAFMPLQIAALAAAKRGRVLSWIAMSLLCLSTIGLLMSGSRGAWLALVVVAFGWCSWLFSEHLASRGHVGPIIHPRRNLWIVAPVVGGIVIFMVVLVTPVGTWLVGTGSDRLNLWRNSLDLASDYPFSGLGLSSFEMSYSSYVLLLHVGYLTHAHNLLLDVWLQQGVLGLLSVVWLFAAAAWQRPLGSPWAQPALASLGVILLHGLVDDAFYGYSGTGILVLFVPFALLTRQAKHPGPAPQIRAAPVWSDQRSVIFLGLGLAVLALAALLLLPGWKAALQANLGALSQTRAELAVYRWPEWPGQDAVRRSSEIDLDPALHHYRAALAQNPANVTANRRLGQIQLSRGQYQAARELLEAAYVTAPDQRATRQLLGESYAVTGDVEQAAALWRTVDSSAGQLGLRRWWYDYIGELQRVTWIAEAAQSARE